MKIRSLIALALACSGLSAATALDAAPSNVAADQAEKVPAEIVRSDFALLYRILQEAHFDLYIHRTKREYDAYYRALAASIRGPMDKIEVAKLFQKFVAYGRIGHAKVDAPLIAFVTHLRSGGTVVPLFIRVDGKRVVLTHAAEESGVLRAGVEVAAIDGMPILDVLDRFGTYVSAERPYMAHAQMEESFPALLWLDRGAVGSVMVTATIEGKAVNVRVPAVTLEQRRGLEAKFPTREPAIDFGTREYRELERGIAYLRPGPFFDTGQAASETGPSYRSDSFKAFIDDSFGKIIASGATDLIIDLRNNPGGDNSFSDPMIAWFADRPFRFASSFMLKASAATKADYARIRASGEPIDASFARQMAVEDTQPNGIRYRYDLPLVQPREGPRYRGRIWILVNRHSYSNAASVAALVQDYGFGKVLGEETADVASNYASVQSFTLPGTGFVVSYPKSHFIRPNGKDEVAGVVPDFRIGRPAIGEAEDVFLKDTLAIVRAQERPRPNNTRP
ncbi:S41 family peptidase [Sphingomonas sp. G-3-2-10]|uniref:S41 family peptidase n=1 Tax=Sphingomonas sp. G-3-2-10 TaxID=2728838 RepID=UPI00146AC1B4|nr:S41 family peptidase [Sphingomonas sp. G-3-2-10]NML04522.1 hypothetical protein [Sphingomonas sp. G-3-2-10]